MADQQHHGNEAKGCGMFDFFKKKDEDKSLEDVATADADQVKEENPAPLEKLQRSLSDSSSSSDEEGDDGEKKKKKKKEGLKEKIMEKISGEKEENAQSKDSCIRVEKCDEKANAEATYPEEKKGFLEKIKEKLPGQHKKAEGATAAGCGAVHEHSADGDEKEKKGILEQIKEKLPGGHGNEDTHKEN